jgi:hypothetical protein
MTVAVAQEVLNQGFLKRTTVDGRVVGFEFLPK